MNDLPGPQGWSAAKGELGLKVKVHEPKVVVPSAVLPPLVMENAGLLAVPPVKATVVAPEMATGAPALSTPAKPLLKLMGAAGVATATKAVAALAAVAGVAATVVSAAATKVVVVGLVLPPQAASALTRARAKASWLGLARVRAIVCMLETSLMMDV